VRVGEFMSIASSGEERKRQAPSQGEQGRKKGKSLIEKGQGGGGEKAKISG